MGGRLRAARKVLRLSPQEAANICGVSLKAYQAYESGQNQMSPLAAYRMYVFSEIPMEWVFAGDLRRARYDLAAQLEEAAREEGVAVGGPVPQLPTETEAPEAAIPATPRPVRMKEVRLPPRIMEKSS